MWLASFKMSEMPVTNVLPEFLNYMLIFHMISSILIYRLAMGYIFYLLLG
ncbi:MAG: hypothetical protein GX271_07110 [Clostridiales bacterium]|jgi:hypothetical protein|nr:hypothetical protein [Clostridiales bacterium]